MIKTTFDLNGQPILFQAATEALHTALCTAWPLPQSQSSRPAFRLTVAEGEIVPAPDDTTLLFDGMMPDKLPCQISESGGTEYYVYPERISLRLGETEGLLTIVPGNERLLRSSIAFQAINAALTLGEQYFVHGAALGLPRGDGAILILGASGRGKTTTTLALLPAGFRLFTDDSAVIKRQDSADHIWGMDVPLKVHRKSAAMLPWLAPLLNDRWNVEDEQPVMPAALSGLGLAVAAPQETLPLVALISLAERSEAKHRLHQLGKAEMLVAIAADNVARGLNGVSPQHRKRMTRLAALVASIQGYRLNAGPDLDSLPQALLAGLDQTA